VYQCINSTQVMWTCQYSLCCNTVWQILLKSVNVCRNFSNVKMWTDFFCTRYTFFPIPINCLNLHCSSLVTDLRNKQCECRNSTAYIALCKCRIPVSRGVLIWFKRNTIVYCKLHDYLTNPSMEDCSRTRKLLILGDFDLQAGLQLFGTTCLSDGNMSTTAWCSCISEARLLLLLLRRHHWMMERSGKAGLLEVMNFDCMCMCPSLHSKQNVDPFSRFCRRRRVTHWQTHHMTQITHSLRPNNCTPVRSVPRAAKKKVKSFPSHMGGADLFPFP